MEEDAFEALLTKFHRHIDHARSDDQQLVERAEANAAEEVDKLKTAAVIRYVAGRQKDRYDKIAKAADDFLKYAVEVGETVEDCGGFRIKHFTRKRFDTASWTHYIQQPESGLRDLWLSQQELDEAKKSMKDDFTHLDTGVKVTPLEVKL
jgi:hypothetical protein